MVKVGQHNWDTQSIFTNNITTLHTDIVKSHIGSTGRDAVRSLDLLRLDAFGARDADDNEAFVGFAERRKVVCKHAVCDPAPEVTVRDVFKSPPEAQPAAP